MGRMMPHSTVHRIASLAPHTACTGGETSDTPSTQSGDTPSPAVLPPTEFRTLPWDPHQCPFWDAPPYSLPPSIASKEIFGDSCWRVALRRHPPPGLVAELPSVDDGLLWSHTPENEGKKGNGLDGVRDVGDMVMPPSLKVIATSPMCPLALIWFLWFPVSPET